MKNEENAAEKLNGLSFLTIVRVAHLDNRSLVQSFVVEDPSRTWTTAPQVHHQTD